MPRAPKTITHFSIDRLRDIKAGADPDALRATTRDGLTATGYAAIQGAITIDQVHSDLQEMKKPVEPEESHLDQMLQLLGTLVTEGQALRTEVRANSIALGRTPAPSAGGRPGSGKRV